MSDRSKILQLNMIRHFNFIVYIATILLIYMWVYSIKYRYDYRTLHRRPNPLLQIAETEYSSTGFHKNLQMKYILEWERPYRTKSFSKEGQKEFLLRKCKVNNCIITRNRRALKSIQDFDAVIFHGPTIAYQYVEKPEARSSFQKYVFVSKESNQNYPICDVGYNDFFNWTWTYKFESDIFGNSFIVKSKKGDVVGPHKIMHWIKEESMKPISKELKGKIKMKTKGAAWFVSKCYTLSKSKRERFVRRLKMELLNYGLKIDVFGQCGNRSCNTHSRSFIGKIKKDYYFYLALEDSFSEDYVTEELLLALQNYVVPIVFGGANYTRFMPDGIYLHGGKMTPKDLAKEMNDIINDKDRYYNFFKWRNHYSYHAREEAPDSDDLCRMCEMLHDEKLMKKTTVYRDFRKWWNVPGKCH